MGVLARFFKGIPHVEILFGWVLKHKTLRKIKGLLAATAKIAVVRAIGNHLLRIQIDLLPATTTSEYTEIRHSLDTILCD